MSKSREILSQAYSYTVADIGTQLFTMAAAILTRRFLGPLQMGIWVTIQLILEYSAYTTLGTATATGREIPYYLGKKDEQTASEIKNVIASFGILTSLVIGLGLLIFALVQKNQMQSTVFWGLVFAAFAVVVQRISNLQITLLRAYKKFDLAAQQMIFSAILNAALIAFLAYRYKIYGFMIAMMLTYLFNVSYIAHHYNFHLRWLLNRRLMGLINFGFPLMLLGMAGELLRGIDSIVIIKLLGFEAMGIYSIAIMASNLLSRIPIAIDVIMVPHFHEKYGQRDKVADVKGYVDKAMFAYSIIMPLMIGISWITAPYFIHLVLPQYVNGIDALRYLLFSSLFFALSFPCGNLIIATKRQAAMFPIFGFTITCDFALILLAVRSGFGISGVAMATSFTFLIHFLLLFFVAGKSIYSWKEGRSVLSSILLRCGFSLTVLVILGRLFRESDFNFGSSVSQLVIFILSQVPFLWALEHKLGIVAHLKEKFFSKTNSAQSS